MVPGYGVAQRFRRVGRPDNWCGHWTISPMFQISHQPFWIASWHDAHALAPVVPAPPSSLKDPPRCGEGTCFSIRGGGYSSSSPGGSTTSGGTATSTAQSSPRGDYEHHKEAGARKKEAGQEAKKVVAKFDQAPEVGLCAYTSCIAYCVPCSETTVVWTRVHRAARCGSLLALGDGESQSSRKCAYTNFIRGFLPRTKSDSALVRSVQRWV